MYPPLIRRLLQDRGADPDDALDLSTISPPLGSQGFLGMKEAVAWIAYAVRHQWPTVIVGDYDVDGACASAILRGSLNGLLPVTSIVPNRFTEGYGLTVALVERIPPETRLVITVDNGVSAHAGVAAAKQRGMTVLVTDHHLPGALRPPADVIVNPNQPGCPFPWKSTCGAAVAWYLVLALHQTYPHWISREQVESQIDLVALATVADLVKLERNNRVLVANGLRRIREGKINPGLSGIAAMAQIELSTIREQDFAFKIGPRLNAAGRLADMQTGIHLLLSRDAEQVERWSRFLETVNAQRKEVQAQIEQEAVEIVNGLSDSGDPVLCVGSDNWHTGVVGIVAGKLKERFERPAFVLTATGEGDMAQGSGRSLDGWHLRDALARLDAEQPGILQRYGGHAMAAGLSIPKSRFDAFRAGINGVLLEQVPTGALHHQVHCDGPLSAAECTLEMARAIEAAGPWGQGFPEPLFENTFVVESSRTMKGGHWKLHLHLDDSSSSPGAMVEAVHFLDGKEVAPEPPPPGLRIRAQYRLQVNRWQGREALQLQVQSAYPAPTPVVALASESFPKPRCDGASPSA
ncbi:MAG: single-stranded-DNA-specific exonuclease RecJ [Gammaproteobacteria bacterium]|nr:single-stranded-DNA-specific exonuclease RecJ [Gammaproteobacteria bacterium]